MISAHQLELYNDLLALAANEAFYTIDQTLDGVVYRIFNYRLASYSDFCNKNALECRGIMFEMNGDVPVRLAARTPEKFFNYRENPFTMNVDFTETTLIMDKADGSLISTFLHNGKVRVKTKASLFSEQAVAAQRIVETDNTLREVLEYWCNHDYTVNLEYVAPSNRIVVAYEKPSLVILSIRHNETGDYVHPQSLRVMNRNEIYNLTLSRWVEYFDLNYIINKHGSVESFVDDISVMEGIEGFVIRLSSGLHLKIKTAWYLTRHRAKDSINSTRRLFEAVLDEAVDDVRALFYDDPVAIKRINEVQEKTDKLYNHLVASVEAFYETNKHLSRKDYAILGQSTFTDGTFGIAMSKYLGKDPGYKEFLKKNYKHYGFTDEVVNEE